MILISLSNVLLTILLLTTLILTVKRIKSTIDFYYSDYLDIAKEKNIDIKFYTDIVTIGPEYVAKNFAWESAGYFWEVNNCNDVVDSLGKNNTSGVDKITWIVNSRTDTYKERRDSYDDVLSKYIK